jgi:signal transduction histidine kinase
MLHAFISDNREAILDIASAKIAARDAPRATENELGDGISQFLDELIETLKFPPSQSPSSHPRMELDSTHHGKVLLRRGFTVAQVIHDYGALCQSITSLAFAREARIGADEFQVLNSCLDDALAGAVTAYLEAREQSMQAESTLRLGVLAHELRNHLNAAMLAFDIIKMGSVGVGGQTSAVLDRSLRGLRNLIDRSLAEVRLATDVTESRELISMATFIEEMEIVAAMEARVLDLRFHVSPVPGDAFIYADRQLLTSALSNLLQNACKFTRPGGLVTLQVRVTGDRALIEVHDECGGLPAGVEAQAIRPFNQAHSNRKGLGLGLVIARRAIARDGGKLRVQDLPGEGCIFTVDMPLAGPLPGEEAPILSNERGVLDGG